MKRACVLVFSGSDPSGGAGMQADIAAIAAHGVHPLSVITVLTAQDNDRVYTVQPVAADLVRQQTQPLIEKFEIAAVKIGIVGNRANAEAIAELIGTLRLFNPALPVVLDPVLASGHGDALAAEDALQAIAPLMAIATVVTPNLLEAMAICSGERRSDTQAETLMAQGCQHVLIKGGHGSDAKVTNRWYSTDGSRSWSWPRLPGTFHGSGCTLASALAAQLAMGKSMGDALELAQDYCQRALTQAYSIAAGQSIPNRSISIAKGKI
jgi:hydroxymethylpyrimidine/phosphomethylpyrimidine kinase